MKAPKLDGVNKLSQVVVTQWLLLLGLPTQALDVRHLAAPLHHWHCRRSS